MPRRYPCGRASYALVCAPPSCNLVSPRSVELSEFEFGLIVAGASVAFGQYYGEILSIIKGIEVKPALDDIFVAVVQRPGGQAGPAAAADPQPLGQATVGSSSHAS